MLRHAASRASTIPSTTALGGRPQSASLLIGRWQSLASRGHRRAYAAAAAATSREKRALNQLQLKGAATTPPPVGGSIPPIAPTSTIPKGTPSPAAEGGTGGGGGGGGGGTNGGGNGLGAATFLAVLAAAAGGFAYYMDFDLIPSILKREEEESKAVEEGQVVLAVAEDEDGKVVGAWVIESEPPAILDETDDGVAAEDSATPAVEETSGGPTSTTPTTETPAVVQEEAKPHTPPPATVPSDEESRIMAVLNELKAQIGKESDRALSVAHQELAKLSSLDMDQLDTMTETQLKVRLVQMARDMEERTKWEAVRLQEFLANKEKEVEDRYVLLIKKLRLEAENLMEERLAQQKKELTQRAEEMLQEQRAASDAFVESSLKIQEQAYLEEKAAYEKTVEEAVSATYEERFGKALADVKKEFATKMDQKVKQLDALSKKLADLEFALKTSQSFQAGSVQAHRLTAAAIALTEKLDSGEPAKAAINALSAVASDNAVVSSAVETIPSSAATKGVATLQELQTSFEEEIYPQVRRAISVPEGQDGLEGQLLGMVFAALKYPPKPDDPAPESDKDAADYVLSRARRHVQLGELEEAAREIDKLKGQAAFAAGDWESSVKDRIAVEKALKVIRMECALANESLGNAPMAV